jgi:uncharacterized protein YlxW (UPF0749 family)
MPNALAFMILLMSAVAAVLSGMAVFSNSRPPDGRVNQVLDELDEVKSLVNQLQKSTLQLERKLDKEQKDARNELKELLEKMAERIDKRLAEG